MAGAWIKVRHDLIDAPEVRRIARAATLDRDQVYGKLIRLWTWFDRHSSNGHLDAEIEDVDDHVDHVGFGAALVSVGWLDAQEGGIVIPHWDRHFSDSAKVRALGQNRAEKHRNATSVTPAEDPVTLTPLPEKIREDNPPPPPREALENEKAAAAALRAAWSTAAKAGTVQPYRARAMPDGFADRLADPGWLDDALSAIGHLPKCRYFKSPVTLIQLCGKGFVAKVLAGQYDAAKADKRPHARPDEPPPAVAWSGEWAEAKRRTLEKLAREAG